MLASTAADIGEAGGSIPSTSSIAL